MRKRNKLVYGVGVNDYKGSVNIDGKMIKSYRNWTNMLKRCYSGKWHNVKPTYTNCSVCNDWLIFSNYKQWHDVNYKEGMQLDKDLLLPGNKIYSAETCKFVPVYINVLLNGNDRARGKWPLGVTYDKKCKSKPYLVQCRDGNGKKIIKNLDSLEEAVAFYSATKTRIVKQQADKALTAGEIDLDIYSALISLKF